MSEPAVNSYAFLHLVLDITQTPPRVEGCVVYSTEWPTINFAKYGVILVEQAGGFDYEDACRKLTAKLEHDPFLRWTLALIDNEKVSTT